MYMFITPINAMIFTVIFLIVSCLILYITTKISNKKYVEKYHQLIDEYKPTFLQIVEIWDVK